MDKMLHEDLKRASIDKIKELLQENQGQITGNTLEAIGDLTDIYKDIENVEYWCEKEESEMYGRYDRDSYNEKILKNLGFALDFHYFNSLNSLFHTYTS